MNLPPLDNVREHIEIPQIFRSDLTGKLIDNCLVCERYLPEPGMLYLIEKAYKFRKKFNSREVIFEYAMCLDCHQELKSSFSAESLQKIDDYFERHVDLEKRRQELLSNVGMDIEKWLSQCVVKGIPIEEMNEYQMLCQCDGDRMIFGYLPYTLSGEAMDDVMQMLSNKTLDHLDGFIDQYFGLPPEFREDPTPRRLLFV